MSAALDLIDRARDDCEAIACELLGPANKAVSTRQALKWGDHGRLTLTITGGQKGKWRDWSSNEFGDILDLIQLETGRDRKGGLEWLSNYYGGAFQPVDHAKRDAERAAASAQLEKDRLARKEWAERLWHFAQPFEGTTAERYLLNRLCGFSIPAGVYEGGALRWNPQVKTMKGQPVPGAVGAMLAAMTDPRTGAFVGVHRTYVDAAGVKLARGMLGEKGICRLWADDAVTTGLSIGEGIETSLSAAVLFDAAPVWAMLDAGQMACFPVLDGIEALSIYADNDPEKKGKRAGPEAAQQCADQWLAAGREVISLTPKVQERDFNDTLKILTDTGAAA